MSFSSSVPELVENSNSKLVAISPRWERVELSFVATILNGYPWSAAFFNDHEGTPIIRIRDVTSGATETRYRGEIVGGFWVEDGDLLVGMDGDFNSRIWTGGRALLNQRVCCISPKESCYLKSFLTIVLPGYLRLIHDDTHSITVKHLSSKTLAQIPLPLPPLAEQRRIVAKIDSLTAKSERAHDNLDHIPRLVEKYKQAVLAAAFRGDLTREWRLKSGVYFDYEPIPIKDIAQIITGSTPPTKGKSIFFGGGTPFVKPGDLNSGYYVSGARDMLTDAGVSVSRVVPAGSTLVTCIGATISKTGFARVSCCTNQQINALIPKSGVVVPEWLYWAVIAPVFQQSIIDNASATTLPIINKGRLQSLCLPRVPVEEQREVVRRLEITMAWIDRLASEGTSARKLIDRLDQAVLAKAFRGELVPQDPADEPASVLLERIRAEHGAAPKPRRGRRPRTAA